MKPTIHIHVNAPAVKTRDTQKPYVSSTKEGWEVLGNKGQLVKSFPKTEVGRAAARKYLMENFEKLTKDASLSIGGGITKLYNSAGQAFQPTKDALSLAEAERELKAELKLIEVFKKSGKPVPKEMIQRQKMLEEEVEKQKFKTGDAIGETFPSLAAAKAKVESLADKGIRAKVNQEVDEATKKMYFVVVRLPSGDAFTEYNPREVARLKSQLSTLQTRYNAMVSGKTPLREQVKVKEEIQAIEKELKGFRS
jgi:myosin heavy subunit